VLFYGRLCETAQTDENMGKNANFQIFFDINQAATMPELSQAEKKFGDHSKHRISASHKPNWGSF